MVDCHIARLGYFAKGNHVQYVVLFAFGKRETDRDRKRERSQEICKKMENDESQIG